MPVQVRVGSDQTTVILQNLLADREYIVTVTAISDYSSSPGLPSPAVTVRTLPGMRRHSPVLTVRALVT